jgi:hypothetical protein
VTSTCSAGAAWKPDSVPDTSKRSSRPPESLSGSPRRIADTLIAQRDTYGMTYFTVQDYHGKYFAQVINALR